MRAIGGHHRGARAFGPELADKLRDPLGRGDKDREISRTGQRKNRGNAILSSIDRYFGFSSQMGPAKPPP